MTKFHTHFQVRVNCVQNINDREVDVHSKEEEDKLGAFHVSNVDHVTVKYCFQLMLAIWMSNELQNKGIKFYTCSN